jgi:hypothetical protein
MAYWWSLSVFWLPLALYTTWIESLDLAGRVDYSLRYDFIYWSRSVTSSSLWPWDVTAGGNLNVWSRFSQQSGLSLIFLSGQSRRTTSLLPVKERPITITSNWNHIPTCTSCQKKTNYFTIETTSLLLDKERPITFQLKPLPYFLSKKDLFLSNGNHFPSSCQRKTHYFPIETTSLLFVKEKPITLKFKPLPYFLSKKGPTFQL